LARATVRHYCVILHAANRKPGSFRERRAYTELWNYLYPIALYKTHNTNLAQDVTQQALVKVWTKRAQCREPGSYLSWATLILINEIREHFRVEDRRRIQSKESAEKKPELTESDMERDDDGEGQSAMDRAESAPRSEGLEVLMADETQRELVLIIQACVKNDQQQRVLIQVFLNDKGYKEIAEELGITVNNVYVLRHRGLEALRKCDAFISYVEENFK
jgi:RNA polymerase sigma factor (sigma-70 family)